MHLFQSTLPTRGSDNHDVSLISPYKNFNPRSPRGGATQTTHHEFDATYQFQSTLPTRGSDRLARMCASYSPPRFQSTLPTRGSDDAETDAVLRLMDISIHAPHEGERLNDLATRISKLEISIHAPHEGERRDCRQPSPRQRGISIHAPHEGERRTHLPPRHYGGYFNPRSPRGGATMYGVCDMVSYLKFQSTLPTRGSDHNR